MISLSRWLDLWRRVGGKGYGQSVFDDLLARYSEPHRHYHNLDHWGFGLDQLDLIRDLSDQPDLVELAWAFHDSVYVIGAQDNEVKSCQLAITILRKAKINGGVQVQVGALIMATKHDREPSTTGERIIVDIDLAILGQDPQTFDQYEQKVREEYKRVDEETFWRIRKGILQGLLDRDQIYSTARFQALYASQARENLARTIAQH